MYVLGIHPDGDYFKVALLKRSGKKMRIIFLQEFKKDILDLNQLKKRILKETRYRHENIATVSALTPEEVFVKNLSFPFAKKSSVIKALPFQIEKLLPFSEEHVTTISEIRFGKKESHVALYTFFNETLQAHLQDIKTLGFDPDIVSTVSKGLARFKVFFIGENEKVPLIYFGWEKSYLIFVEGCEAKHSLVIDVGFRMLIDAARTDFPSVEEVDLHFLKNEISKFFKKEIEGKNLKFTIGKLQKGLWRSFEYIKRKEGLDQLNLVHLGYSSITEEMTENMLELSSKKMEISPHLEFDRQELCSYAIEIGLALDSFEGNKNPLQFRIGEFAPAKQMVKIKQKIKAFLGVSTICSMVIALLMTLIYLKKEQGIRERFNYIVSLGGEEPKLYSAIQKNFFSEDQFNSGVNLFLEKTKKLNHNGGFLREPYCLTSYMSELSKSMEIKDIGYELLEYPNISSPKNAYMIKLQILYTCKSDSLAKKAFEEFSTKFKEGIQEKSLEYIKEKNGYQMVLVLKQEC